MLQKLKSESSRTGPRSSVGEENVVSPSLISAAKETVVELSADLSAGVCQDSSVQSTR
jgi:hypothetical protein